MMRSVNASPALFIVAVLGAVLMAMSCDAASKGTPEREKAKAVTPEMKTQPTPEDRAEKDTWDRSRQCAEQAERFVKRLIEEGRGGPFKVMGWFNHYSPKFQKCYVRVSYYNALAKSDKEQPLLPFGLYDAFENREIAFCSGTPSPLCQFLGDDGSEIPGDCAGCQRFVNERIGGFEARRAP